MPALRRGSPNITYGTISEITIAQVDHVLPEATDGERVDITDIKFGFARFGTVYM